MAWYVWYVYMYSCICRDTDARASEGIYHIRVWPWHNSCCACHMANTTPQVFKIQHPHMLLFLMYT